MGKKYTREEKRQFKKKNRIISIISGIVVGMFTVSTGYLIINILKLKGIEDLLRYIGIGVLCLIVLIAIYKNFKYRFQPKKSKYILLILILLLFGAGEFYLSKNVISRGIGIVDNLNKDEINYTSSLIAMKESTYDKKTIKDGKVGIISNTDDTEGYVLAQHIIEKDKIDANNLYEYDDYITMLKDLYTGTIDACFVSGSYVDKYDNLSMFENIREEVKELDKYTKRMKKQTDQKTESNTKSVTEPFTMLILGVDSTEEQIEDAGGLGDTIILFTFNPKTLNATMFSIPRDTYVPVSCYGNTMSKITHAASGGDSCMISTVENFTGIEIDYYAKINFLGMQRLVDKLGGIDVDVPYAFCETTMWRSLEYMVYVDKGMQHLNGEQALGLSRNRKYYPQCGEYYNDGDRNDFVRGQNQQLVIKGILKKAKKIRSVDQFYDILDTVSKSLDTNLTREQILDFYNVFKKVLLSSDSLTEGNDVISVQRTYLNGIGGIYADGIAGTGLYEFLPSRNSLDAIVHAMKVNLEMEEETYPTEFTFNIDKPYETEIIGSDEWGAVDYYPEWVEPEEEQPKPTVKCEGNLELGGDGQTCICPSSKGYHEVGGTCCLDEDEDGVCDDSTEDPNSEGGESGGGESGGGESGGNSGGGESGGGESGGGESGGESGGNSGGGESTGDSSN